MNKYQELYDYFCKVYEETSGGMLFRHYLDELYDLIKKYPTLDKENFDLKQKINTLEKCCVVLEKLEEKVRDQVDIIKSLAKALEDNGIDLSYLIFSYLTLDEWSYIKEILESYKIAQYFRSDTDE